MIKRHLKLFIVIALELVFILCMAAGAIGKTAEMSFSPADFSDNARGRSDISVDDTAIHFYYDERLTEYDDEGRVLGEDLKSGKFSLGSGAYFITVDYKAEAENAFAELFSESWVTETVSSKIFLPTDKMRVSSKVYIPFARSMHDIQMNIHYTGPDDLIVYGITLTEDKSYRWVPVTGYLLLFALLDLVIWLLFARSAHTARGYIRGHYEITAGIVIMLLASLPAFADFLYVGHDMPFHLARIIAVSHEIAYGQFPVRMLTDMLKGYSYPTSTFYCDFFMYPFALLYLLGLPLRMSWQIYVIAVNIVTVMLSYFAFGRISRSRDIGIIGAAVYSLSAYRIVDIFLRSAMGEFTAMSFIPLVILGIWIIYYEPDLKTKRSGWLYLGLGMSAIAMCHLLSLEMISLFLIVFCLLEYKKTFTGSVLLSIGKAALMTVLLSCWFIFPMLISMRQIGISMYDHQTYIQSEGAYPSQVFNFFMRGSGYSTTATPAEMPLSIGGGILAAFALLIYAVLKRNLGNKGRQRTAFILTGLSLCFAMYFFPWDSIAGITEGRLEAVSRLARMVQYPWRFLEITTAVLSVCAVCIIKEITDAGEEENTDSINRQWKGVCSARFWIGLLLLGTALSLGSFYDPFINEAEWTRAADEYYMDKSIGREEYLPEGSGRLMDLPAGVETSGEDDLEVISYDSQDGERRLTVRNDGGDASVLIPVFAYPGYRACDADTLTEMAVERGENARIKLSIPGGYKGTVRVYYRESELWRLFEIISLAAFLIYGAVLVDDIRKQAFDRG